MRMIVLAAVLAHVGRGQTPGDSSRRLKSRFARRDQRDALVWQTGAVPRVQSVFETKRQLSEMLTSGRLVRTMARHVAAYKDAQPFPHAIIDGLFPDGVINALMHEIQETPGKGFRCYNDRLREFNKCEGSRSDQWGPHTRAYISFVRSPAFMAAVEALTGFGTLDPMFGELVDGGTFGAGIHVTGDKGRLNVHADFNKGPGGTERRVNSFIYLNPDWNDEFGGHLQLWNRDMSKCVQNIRPSLNRFVVFTCTDWSFHGHPEPMALPPGRARRSIAVYYYSKSARPAAECAWPDPPTCLDACRCRQHNTLFMPSKCGACVSNACGGAELTTA